MKIPETAKNLLENMIAVLDARAMKDQANDLRVLRDDLDSQSTYIFDCEDEFESKTRFINVIMQYLGVIGSKEFNKKFYSTNNVQKQLIKALRKAAKVPATEKEAKRVIEFIQTQDSLWADGEDSYALVRNFKLITDEKGLEKISSKYQEMPTDNFQGIRIFYKYESVLERIRKEKRISEWKKCRYKEYGEGMEPLWIFEWWYGLHATGTYYIYVPDVPKN